MKRVSLTANILVGLVFLFLPIQVVAAFSQDAVEEEYAQLRYIADSLHAVGHTDSAIIVAEQAFDMALRGDRKSWLLGTHSALGVFLRSTGKIDEALKHYDEALKIVVSNEFRKEADEDALEEVSALYLNLSTLHFDMSHKEEAAKYAVTATEWAERCTDKDFRGQIFNAAGPVLSATGQPELALEFQQKGYGYALESGNDDAALKSAAYNMLSCDRLGRTKETDQWRDKCRELMKRVDVTMSRLTYYQVECSISMSHDNTADIISWFDSILNLDGIQNLPFVMLDCYNNMHTVYDRLGKSDLAYETLLKSNALRDSLFEQSKAESLRELTVKYDAKEKELALAVSEAERSKVSFWLLVVVALLAMTGFLFVIYTLRQRHLRQKREAEFAKLRHSTEQQLTIKYIEGLESERARMARELHDGVCNDLVAVQMILSEENPSSPSLAMLNTCREQVRRISHEMMPPEFSHAHIDEVLRYYVHKLDKSSGSVRCTYTSSPENADWNIVPDDMSLEIYRVVQEAAGNAIKHAAAQNVHVSLNRMEKKIVLTIADNGRPQHVQNGGIGRRTMKQRAIASGGSLTIDSSESGTVVRFVIQI